MARWLAPICSVFATIFWVACARESSSLQPLRAATEVSGEARFNPRAGHGEALYITLRGPGGEAWRFLVDTGAPDTMLDRSLVGKLGPALGTEAVHYGWFGARQVEVFGAPPLSLGGLQLRTGSRVLVDDFRRLFPRRDVQGILGMDCLRHYCVELDFAAGILRLRNAAPPVGGAPAQTFRLGESGGGIFIEAGFLGTGPADFQVDTGCTIDAVLEARRFQQATRQEPPLHTRSFRSPAGRPVQESIFASGFFGGERHARLIVDGADDNLLGLRFLARHQVTLDFPRHTLLLRRR